MTAQIETLLGKSNQVVRPYLASSIHRSLTSHFDKIFTEFYHMEMDIGASNYINLKAPSAF